MTLRPFNAESRVIATCELSRYEATPLKATLKSIMFYRPGYINHFLSGAVLLNNIGLWEFYLHRYLEAPHSRLLGCYHGEKCELN